MEGLKKNLSGEIVPSLNLELIVKECFNTTDQIQKSKRYLHVITSIKKGIINPNDLLVIGIGEVSKTEDLSLIALLLRHGANPNMYVNTTNLGVAHVIIFTVFTLRNRSNLEEGKRYDLMSVIILLLLIFSSEPNSIAFNRDMVKDVHEVIDTNFVKNVTNVQIEGMKPEVKYQTVKDWLKMQSLLDMVNSPEEILARKSEIARTNIGTICNRVDLIVPDKLNFQKIIESRADKVMAIYQKKFLLEKGEYSEVVSAIEGNYYSGFVILDIPVTYFTITRILLHLKFYLEDKDSIAVLEMQNILKYCVARGIKIDFSQMAILSTTNSNVANNILKEYNKPSWQKFCSRPDVGEVNEELRVLSHNLNIESISNKKSLCQKLDYYFSADQEKLKKSVVKRQRARLTADLSNISDFISGSPEQMTCTNRTILEEDPLEYSDAAMSYYKDSDGQVWCFLSNMYKSLLDSKVNPHTSKPLPESYQDQIKSHINILERLGISLTDPKTINSAIDDLHRDDEVTSKESEKIVSTIEQTAEISGIRTASLKKLTPEQMNNVLATINMDQFTIVLSVRGRYVLTKEHQYITFCRAAYVSISKNPANSRTFFTNINLYTTEEK